MFNSRSSLCNGNSETNLQPGHEFRTGFLQVNVYRLSGNQLRSTTRITEGLNVSSQDTAIAATLLDDHCPIMTVSPSGDLTPENKRVPDPWGPTLHRRFLGSTRKDTDRLLDRFCTKIPGAMA